MRGEWAPGKISELPTMIDDFFAPSVRERRSKVESSKKYSMFSPSTGWYSEKEQPRLTQNV